MSLKYQAKDYGLYFKVKMTVGNLVGTVNLFILLRRDRRIHVDSFLDFVTYVLL